jgi:hypothetical protein
MDNYEINSFLKKYRNYIGTFPRDKLPKNMPVNSGCIINTDTSKGPGEHWVSVYLDEYGAEYFDSFGLIPMHKEIIRFLDRISPNGWWYNRITFQSLHSDTCGNYCVYYMSVRLNGKTFDDFRKVFNFTTRKNDILAKFLYKG